LYYHRARYRDASFGTWLSADPSGFDDGPNLYTYVGNNPINWIDSWGLKRIKGIDGETVEVHKNDPDPFPSKPHGHIQGTNKKVNVHTGEIFEGGKKIGTLSKKGLSKLQSILKKSGLIGIGVGVGLDILSGEGLADSIMDLLDSPLYGDELGEHGEGDSDGDGIPDFLDDDTEEEGDCP